MMLDFSNLSNLSNHVSTLADLVRRPSVNPMGRDVSGPEYLETRVTDYLVQRFLDRGIPCARQQVAPGRDNVVARLEGSDGGDTVMLWDAHQDTVPVEGMTIDPFSPVVRNGRLWGRGACDVKGGMAAMLTGLDRLCVMKAKHPTILFSATVNEEFGFSGIKALTRLWSSDRADILQGDHQARELLPRIPDVAIVAEPTELNIVTTHKGATRWRIKVYGRACHSAYPERGDNAIYTSSRVVAAIETLSRELARRNPSHPCGPPTLNVGTIRGGSGVNLVPDFVILEIERRLVPGESSDVARREVIDRVRHATPGARVDHEEPFLESLGLPEDSGGAFVERLISAALATGVHAEKLSARYGTNASVLAASGVKSVVFGPGSIEQAHTVDEWIDLDQVDQAASILVELASAWSEKPARRATPRPRTRPE